MVKYRESITFVDVFCLERDLDAANLMDSGFAKAWRNLQFLDLPDVSFVAGAGRGQPYGFRFCESFAQFAIFGLARCIFRGRRRTRPTLWFQILRKLRAICNFWTCKVHFSWQAQDAANLMVSDFAKTSHNLQLLALRDAFCVAGAGRGQPYDHFSWQALYESTNRKVTRFQPYDLHFFLCFFSQSDRKVGFLWQVQYFVTFRLFSRGRATTSES